MAHSDIEQLRTEWMGLFDRVLAAGEQLGREAVGAEMIRAAHAVVANHIAAKTAASAATPNKSESSHRVVRARSGHVQEIVLATLEQSLVPLLPLKIVETANAKDPQSPLKVSSTRMALAALKEKGRVIKNDLGEWTVTPRSTRPTLRAKIDPLMWDNSHVSTQN